MGPEKDPERGVREGRGFLCLGFQSLGPDTALSLAHSYTLTHRERHTHTVLHTYTVTHSLFQSQ